MICQKFEISFSYGHRWTSSDFKTSLKLKLNLNIKNIYLKKFIKQNIKKQSIYNYLKEKRSNIIINSKNYIQVRLA